MKELSTINIKNIKTNFILEDQCLMKIDGKIFFLFKKNCRDIFLRSVIEENNLEVIIKEKVIEEINKNMDKIMPFMLTYNREIRVKPWISLYWNHESIIEFYYCINTVDISPYIIEDIKKTFVV